MKMVKMTKMVRMLRVQKLVRYATPTDFDADFRKLVGELLDSDSLRNYVKGGGKARDSTRAPGPPSRTVVGGGGSRRPPGAPPESEAS